MQGRERIHNEVGTCAEILPKTVTVLDRKKKSKL